MSSAPDLFGVGLAEETLRAGKAGACSMCHGKAIRDFPETGFYHEAKGIHKGAGGITPWQDPKTMRIYSAYAIALCKKHYLVQFQARYPDQPLPYEVSDVHTGTKK